MPVDQGQAAEGAAVDVGRHVRAEQRSREAGAVGGHQQQVPQVFDLCVRVGHLVQAPAGQAELCHEELNRAVAGQRGDLRLLAGDPLFDLGGAAVGDDAQANLPGTHLSLALVADELEHQKNPEQRSEQQKPGAQCHAPVGALSGRRGRIAICGLRHGVPLRCL